MAGLSVGGSNYTAGSKWLDSVPDQRRRQLRLLLPPGEHADR